MSQAGAATIETQPHNDIVYPSAVPFVLMHLACFAAIWTGVSLTNVLLCVGLYFVRMFIVTAVYHRYFSHKSFKTSRVLQFVMAFLVQTSAQRGVVWWAATHREHHKHSDTALDVHSPDQHGFWFSHVGWIFTKQRDGAPYELVPDLTRYPELRFLNTIWMRYTPSAVLALATWALLGWPGLVVVYVWSTVLLYHGSFSINSLAHVYGNQRYLTGDNSRNNWWLAIITMGEGWHNNHHHFQSSTRQGFFWWEYDPTFYGLKILSWFGLVWDLTGPPAEVIAGDRRPPRKVVERVAHQLAFSFSVESISQQLQEAWQNGPGVDELRKRLAAACRDAGASMSDLHMPELPSVEDLKARAREMYANSPSLDDVAARAREILLEAVASHLGALQPVAVTA